MSLITKFIFKNISRHLEMHFPFCHFTDEYFSSNSIYKTPILRSPGPETSGVSRPHPLKKGKKNPLKTLNSLLSQPKHWTSYFYILPSSFLWHINKQNSIFLMSFTLAKTNAWINGISMATSFYTLHRLSTIHHGTF